jgi:membrane protease YdiL (CAAX protease family)
MQGSTTLPPRRWLPVPAVLFAAYQLPEALARLGAPAALPPLMMLAFLPIAWAAARFMGMSMGRAYALEATRPAAIALATGLVLAIAAKCAGLIAGQAMGIYLPQAHPQAASAPQLAGALAWLALATFVPSIAEDILTRGFWMRIPAWPWTAATFVGATSLIYLFNHIFRLGHGAAEWFMLLCFGVAYGAACRRGATLWAAVGLHWGWNFAGQALDVLWPLDIQDADAARLLSGAVHLFIAVLVPLAFRRGAWRGEADAATN